MKKLFFSFAVVALLGASSCTPKCGHCEYETTFTQAGGSSNVQKNKSSISCGDNGNESGSYHKANELDCKAWAAKQPTQTGTSYASTWVADK